MCNVKMTFTVEIDGETIISHQIEAQAEKRAYFSQERKLAKEVIDKMNEFHSERWINAKPWADLEELKKQNPKELSFALKNQLA
ncbi:hypothetical protein E5134_10825 [Pasteurella multocida]|uniref:hypothetical protein n=1 Tax=Pasteurella multocida TaxID=747 RepID=UPI0007F94328|nr:hypothetical protein [Pasteurella multocida]MDY4593637.1 hypothetical protein [[Pasteurella] aerogenes]OBP21250.1 hypothetical protein A0R64_08125 [Pasteurella multocida subsp. multocida]QCA34465.1 hypothetical protein E5134_10825 [Pasteurella multocida]UWZ95032.1 hypothetical protein A0R66_009310 [Pasteurella multocida subsp. multocida]HDX0980437.1 hypothetical protein [Pasteurella multocida]